MCNQRLACITVTLDEILYVYSLFYQVKKGMITIRFGLKNLIKTI